MNTTFLWPSKCKDNWSRTVRKAAILLEIFTEEYPPPPGKRHALLLPSDDDPAEAVLVLLLWVPEAMHIHIESEDLDKTADELFKEVHYHLSRMVSTKPASKHPEQD